MLRRLVPVTAAAALLLTAGLTGCSSQPQLGSDECTSEIGPGGFVDNLRVEGGAGEVPSIVLPENVPLASPQMKVLKRAEDRGDAVSGESLVGMNLATYDVLTGQVVSSSPGFTDPSADPEMVPVLNDAADVFGQTLKCAAPGDRIAVALPPQAPGSPSVVGVIDVRTVAPASSSGRVRGLPAGYPAVVTNDEGQPGIVLPPGSAPEETESAVRVAGKGDKIGPDDQVIAQVLSVGWDGRQRTNSRTEGGPTPNTNDMSWRSELDGQRIGSQVVVLDANDGDPQVVIVDILGVL